MVLKNIQVSPSTLTATATFGSAQQVYDVLLGGFRDYLSLVSTANRGVVVAQLAKIISNLEVDTRFGVHGGAALALNTQIAANVTDSAIQPATPTNTKTYNECIDPAALKLPTGFRSNLVFTVTGPAPIEQTVDSVIDGPGFTFEGQSAIQESSTITTKSESAPGSLFTLTSITKLKTYQQIGTNGLVKILGSTEDTITTTFPSGPSFPSLSPEKTSSKFVNNPPDENIEYTLKLGSSLNKTVSSTGTITSGGVANVLPASTGTLRNTFEAKESITLASGQSYNTCRYKISSLDGRGGTINWLIIGKGVLARSQSFGNGPTVTTELKSGTYNGTAL